MKTLISFLIATFVVSYAFSQSIGGAWYGMLNVSNTQLLVVLNVDDSGGELKATLDSPDQGAFGIPITIITFKNNQLNFVCDAAHLSYTGTFTNDHFEGTFKQGQSIPMALTREKPVRKPVVRPQEPKAPFPYTEEEVTFRNEKAGITLAGTLTTPTSKGKHPAVVLISGSGPQNRDEELMGHKPFWILADYLTREGIAVLRFDDRGVGKSEGDQGSATSVDFSTDAESAFCYLKTRSDIDSKSIGLMGHSEGGLIAPMVAARNHELGFIVMLAGPGMTGKELLPEQAALISKASGVSDENIRIGREINNVIYSMIDTVTPTEELAKKLNDYIDKMVAENKMPSELSSKEMIDIQMKQLISPWMRYFLNYDPRPALRKVTCPVLALNGEKDLQVPPVENLREIEKALKEGGNSNYTIKQFNGLNHLFQECKTGSPEEYSSIEQTFSPDAMKQIATWITKQTK